MNANEKIDPACGQVEHDYVGIKLASDIYTLGVLLYELVTGHSPYRLERQTVSQLEHAICHQEADMPSKASSRLGFHADNLAAISTPEYSERRCRRLRGDLDEIIMTALRKEPHERYSSASRFADDLRNHLNGRPVLARKGERWYRATKWLTRRSLHLLFA